MRVPLFWNILIENHATYFGNCYTREKLLMCALVGQPNVYQFRIKVHSVEFYLIFLMLGLETTLKALNIGYKSLENIQNQNPT